DQPKTKKKTSHKHKKKTNKWLVVTDLGQTMQQRQCHVALLVDVTEQILRHGTARRAGNEQRRAGGQGGGGRRGRRGRGQGGRRGRGRGRGRRETQSRETLRNDGDSRDQRGRTRTRVRIRRRRRGGRASGGGWRRERRRFEIRGCSRRSCRERRTPNQ